MTAPEVPDEVWEHLAELGHEIAITEMDAERLEDYGEHEQMATKCWRRAAELHEEFADYAAKHGIPVDEPEADRELEHELERDEEKEIER